MISSFRKSLFCGLLFLLSASQLLSQSIVRSAAAPDPDTVRNSANMKTAKYDGYFLYGSNSGYLNNQWSDMAVADLLAGSAQRGWDGVGVNSLRPALYEGFIEQYGNTIRIKEFEYYTSIGLRYNAVSIGDRPSPQHQEKKYYTPDAQSLSYRNLYEPIWDNGENGTPVNDSNYYAVYVYNLVKLYGPHVKFWEIKNEIDYSRHPTCAGNGPEAECNWWTEDPSPKLLTNFYAPVQSYIRMLRVSYEVIKHVDPDAFVCIGGIGYASFLDAVLRNTDNPDGGIVTDQYPLKGGAWFDCLSYHVYPMYYLNEAEELNYRHSDAAVRHITNHKKGFTDVLEKYGYDGKTYPEKPVIITETNVPNRVIEDKIGSEEAQRNYLIKGAVIAQRENISAVYVHGPWDNKERHITQEIKYQDFDGFYKPIPVKPGSNSELRFNESGIGWRTMSNLLNSRKYNRKESDRLNLPGDVDGGAFHSPEDKDYVYVLWARTTKDMNETASASYTFPFPADKRVELHVTSWDNQKSVVSGNTINLTGSPVFVTVVERTDIPVTGIALNQTIGTMDIGKTLQLEAIITPADATNKQVLWQSSDTKVATVDQSGKVTAVSAGNVVIMATTADGNKTATCSINVRSGVNVPVSYIQLTPSSKTMIIGDIIRFVVTFVPANTTNQEITWTSSDESVATVDAEGTVTAYSEGKVIITATPGDGGSKLAKYSTVTVKQGIPVSGISLNYQSKGLDPGEEFQLTATVTPGNAATKSLVWTSSNDAVANVDKNGKVYAVAAGYAIITATTVNGGYTASCNITVGGELLSITLNPAQKTLNIGDVFQPEVIFNPANITNKELAWSSNNQSVAKVDATGKITAVGAGSVTITAKASNGLTAACVVTVKEVELTSITLSPVQKVTTIGEVFSLYYTLAPANATNKQLTWSTSNASVARVDATGRVTAVGAGSSTITATTSNGLTATCVVTVKEVELTSITLSPVQKVTTIGEVFSLYYTLAPANATNKQLTWSTSNTSVARVDATGRVTAVGAGSSTITATTSNGLTATSTVTVTAKAVGLSYIQLTPSMTTVTVGDVLSLNVTFFPSNATNQELTWTSSDETIATVDADGRVTAVSDGKATITAIPADGGINRSKYCTLTVRQGTVVSSIALNYMHKTLTLGEYLQLTAAISPSNATNKNLVWSSSNPSIAGVDKNGLVQSLSAGTATVTVTSVSGGLTATCTITVREDIRLMNIALKGSKDDNVPEENVIIVYPNPTRGNLRVDIGHVSEGSLLLYNASGKLLEQRTHITTSNEMDLSGYPDGIYFIRIILGDEVHTRKIVKE